MTKPPRVLGEDPRGVRAAARARGLIAGAESQRSQGHAPAAARLLLEAAALLVDAADRAPTVRERQDRWDLATSLHRRARRMDPATGPERNLERAAEPNKPSETPGPVPARAHLTFDDVVGMEGVKDEIRRKIIYPLQHPEIYGKYGQAAGGAILMHGPPGCGKTFIAQAAAGESGAAFFPVQLADVLSQYVGGSERALRDLFGAARTNRPSIIFLDEIDAIGGDRDQQQADHGRRLLNQLLTLMDGVTQDGTKALDGILVIGATNRPDSLDPALVRSGRFTTKLAIPLPDERTRRSLATGRLGPLEAGTRKDTVETIVQATEGGNAADVVAACDEVLMGRILAEIEGRQAADG